MRQTGHRQGEGPRWQAVPLSILRKQPKDILESFRSSSHCREDSQGSVNKPLPYSRVNLGSPQLGSLSWPGHPQTLLQKNFETTTLDSTKQYQQTAGSLRPRTVLDIHWNN